MTLEDALVKQNTELQDTVAKWMNVVIQRNSEVTDLKVTKDKLIQAASKLLQAMNQKQFCMEGYRSGGASISEVNAASDEEHKAYSELFEIVRELKK